MPFTSFENSDQAKFEKVKPKPNSKVLPARLIISGIAIALSKARIPTRMLCTARPKARLEAKRPAISTAKVFLVISRT
ncbi:hypothetical protein D3C87_1980960 [compost metagenome]